MTSILDCKHDDVQGSENYGDLNISFCRDCGTIIITTWDDDQIQTSVAFITPWDAFRVWFLSSSNIKDKIRIVENTSRHNDKI